MAPPGLAACVLTWADTAGAVSYAPTMATEPTAAAAVRLAAGSVILFLRDGTQANCAISDVGCLIAPV
jgi:hypothetical protein